MELNSLDSDVSTEVALISCVLFSAFESLQGHYSKALTHINCGIEVIDEQEMFDQEGNFACFPKYLLRSRFLRLDTQALEIGDDTLKPTIGLLESPHMLPMAQSADEIPTEPSVKAWRSLRLFREGNAQGCWRRVG